MPNINLAGREKLLLHELLQYLQEETGTPIVDWLHLIACAVDPDNDNQPNLTLRPDNSWQLFSHHVTQVEYHEPWVNRWVSNPRPPIESHRTESVYVSWSLDHFEKSILFHYIDEPNSIRESRDLKSLLNKEGIRIHRDDFRTWCQSAGYPLPRFWFPEEQREQVPSSSKKSHSKKSLEAKLTELVIQLFWESPPPAGHNRPTKTQIIDWLMEYAAADGLTEKAAARIFTSSRPEHIPKHGNLPHDKKPFPLPPYPSN